MPIYNKSPTVASLYHTTCPLSIESEFSGPLEPKNFQISNELQVPILVQVPTTWRKNRKARSKQG